MSKRPRTWKTRRIEWLRKAREFGLAAKALASTSHPIAAQIIPIRRCNLSCRYCNEYDETSPPVPAADMIHRIDRLAALGLSSLTFSGGEPLLHPDLDRLIRRVRERGMLAGVITNGFLLNPDRIGRFNAAGLDYLQISIDNVEPDDISMKSLKTLDARLVMLARYAEFHVNINSVLGAGVRNPEDAAAVTQRALDLGLTTTVGIIHDGDGQLRAVSERERSIYARIRRVAKGSYSRINQHNPYQENLLAGKPNHWWWCRAGGRYLYVCEDGLVHYCSQQRGYPGIPLEQYTTADIRREYLTKKSCAPYCTISCVHQTSIVDRWRDPQVFEFSSPPKSLVSIEPLPHGSGGA
ncbi:MAG TPA: radical SAM protein [Bryobacteraceae bacterium]|jgi:MoaA/NifB/PqqE/SkfB family radical SAM enzyme|nr:radical SAM protein [Bryobacteraceae bacterium]